MALTNLPFHPPSRTYVEGRTLVLLGKLSELSTQKYYARDSPRL